MDSQPQDRRQVAYYIFRTKMTVNGVTLYAKDYGLKGVPYSNLSIISYHTMKKVCPSSWYEQNP